MQTSDIHHQPSLVEGDFFPLESESEVDELVDSSDVEVPRLNNTRPGLTMQSPLSREKKKIKACWADSDNARNLCETVADFFLPKSSRTAVPVMKVRPANVPQPTTIVSDRKNGDGVYYRFFPSQRPSSRILELRAVAKRGGGAPYQNQPGFVGKRVTLFSSLFPRVPVLFSEGRKRTASIRDTLPLSPAVGSGFPQYVLTIPVEE